MNPGLASQVNALFNLGVYLFLEKHNNTIRGDEEQISECSLTQCLNFSVGNEIQRYLRCLEKKHSYLISHSFFVRSLVFQVYIESSIYQILASLKSNFLIFMLLHDDFFKESKNLWFCSKSKWFYQSC